MCLDTVTGLIRRLAPFSVPNRITMRAVEERRWSCQRSSG
jgi:hypothetical protein